MLCWGANVCRKASLYRCKQRIPLDGDGDGDDGAHDDVDAHDMDGGGAYAFCEPEPKDDDNFMYVCDPDDNDVVCWGVAMYAPELSQPQVQTGNTTWC